MYVVKFMKDYHCIEYRRYSNRFQIDYSAIDDWVSNICVGQYIIIEKR